MEYSEQEKVYYYHGLTGDSAPRLIARSSRDPFRYAFNDFTQGWPSETPAPELKGISTIGSHPIVKIYDEKLRSKVLDILEGIKWQCIDIVRIGYHDEGPGKPAILVTGEETDIDPSQAQRAVDEIHSLMVENDLSDVHAKFKTGHYSDLRNYFGGTDIFPTALNVTPLLGAGIANEGTKTSTGSFCLYLTIQGVPYALSCRHVVSAKDAPCPGMCILSILV